MFWPARVATRQQLVIFRLHLWDAGDSAVRKYAIVRNFRDRTVIEWMELELYMYCRYGHVYPVCRENASAVILTFSFTDRQRLENYVYDVRY